MTRLEDLSRIDIPKIHDAKGNLSVLEGQTVPFEFKRVYYLYDVPSTAERHGNAHKTLKQFLIALSGSFEVVVHDGENQSRFMLNRPNQGLYIPEGIWRSMENFSSGAVCLVLASEVYDEADYLRDFSDFQSFKNGIS